MSANNYEDMNLKELLKKMYDEEVLIPDFQRKYVWTISDIEELFESILAGYPIGTFIFWKVNDKQLNNEQPELYKFLKTVRRRTTNMHKPINEEGENDPVNYRIAEGDYYVVLDGQQRLTSLYIAMYGSYNLLPKGGRANNNKAWIEKRLYYDFDYDSCIDPDDRGKRFRFLSDEEASECNCFPVKDIITYTDSYALSDDIKAKYNVDGKKRRDIGKLFDAICNAQIKLVHYYEIPNDCKYDDALDIFVKVNSTGQPLTKGELVFSSLVKGWQNGRKEIETLIGEMNNNGFRFDQEYVVRLLLYLSDVDTRLRVSNITDSTIHGIQKDWGKMKKICIEMSKRLKNAGVMHGNLRSYNATMPIAYYLYKGGKIEKKDYLEIRKYLALSTINRVFAGSSNSVLSSLRTAIQNAEKKDPGLKKTAFSANLFYGVNVGGPDRSYAVDKKIINRWFEIYKKGDNETYAILSLLYSDAVADDPYHQDHCHPETEFKESKLKKITTDDQKIKDWIEKCQLLPNLQLLTESQNRDVKNKMPLKDWVAKFGHEVKYCDKTISLDLKDFDRFYSHREKKMKNKLFEIFNL